MPDVENEARMLERAEMLLETDLWDALSWDDAWRGVYPEVLLPDERAKRTQQQIDRIQRILSSDVTALTGTDSCIYFDLKTYD